MEENPAQTYDFTDYYGGFALMEKSVAGSIEKLVSAVKQTDIYATYSFQVKKIQRYPDLMEQINAYREENFMLQSNFEGDELFDKMEEFNSKYEQFLENPVVNDYLSAETALCRMMQEINTNIIEGLDFQ